MLRFTTYAALALACAASSVDPLNPYNLTDCRGQNTSYQTPDGKLQVLSWHIHYNTNTSDQPRFYDAFVAKFADYFDPSTRLCPFGPNFGLASFKYVCSLESAPEEPWALESAARYESTLPPEQRTLTKTMGGPWEGPQRAFFVPKKYMEELWAWAQPNRGYTDVFLHPNTGCMHDDHGHRGTWVLGEGHKEQPGIKTLEFPCNMPTTGCQDKDYRGPPTCGCNTPLASDAPEDSCKNCKEVYDI